jgi:hypothetical protein
LSCLIRASSRKAVLSRLPSAELALGSVVIGTFETPIGTNWHYSTYSPGSLVLRSG